MITATIITIVQKFVGLLQLFSECETIWSIEIVFGSEYNSWWELGNLCHGGFTWEDINARQMLLSAVSAGALTPYKLHKILNFGIREFD